MAYKVTKYFLEVFGDRISAGDPRVIEELVESGCLGKKNGKGEIIVVDGFGPDLDGFGKWFRWFRKVVWLF